MQNFEENFDPTTTQWESHIADHITGIQTSFKENIVSEIKSVINQVVSVFGRRRLQAEANA